jgi:hypothetical protein
MADDTTTLDLTHRSSVLLSEIRSHSTEVTVAPVVLEEESEKASEERNVKLTVTTGDAVTKIALTPTQARDLEEALRTARGVQEEDEEEESTDE